MTQREYSTGISNCHYAVRLAYEQVGALGKLPGAVKLSNKSSSENRSFTVRDGSRVYQHTSARKTKERPMTLEIIGLTKDFLVDVLGWTLNEDGSLTEGVHPDVHISLFYETENGGRPVRHWLYDCVVGEPSFDASTIAETPNVDTYTLDIIKNPDPYRNGDYSRKIARADNAELFDSWFGLKQNGIEQV